MTDLEKFIDTYKQFDIDVKTYEKDGLIEISLNEERFDKNATLSNKFDGYYGFYSILKFTKEGKFITQGFWE